VSHPTPHFALYGTTPSYDHVRVFDCACYPNTSATAPDKRTPRSTRCLFLGYSRDHKGYRCLDLATHRILISRHVVFDEDVIPLASSSPPPNLVSLRPIQLPSTPVAHVCFPPGSDATARACTRTPRGSDTSPCVVTRAMRGLVDERGPLRRPRSRLPPSRAGHSIGPAEPALLTSAARFANPALVYHCRKMAPPSALDDPPARTEPPVYHTVAIHHDPGHVHPMVTCRAAGVLHPVDRLILAADMTATPPDASPVPPSVRASLADPHWCCAMEYTALLANHTWDLVPRPLGTNMVTGKWLFRHKLTSDGSIDRYKARWVFRCFTQHPEVDYDETFSPGVKFATVRAILSLTPSKDWAIHQLDVKNAFLHGTLTETVYCSQPSSFVDAARSDLVCRLNRSLYGLKQAPRA
jgi:hypothetical protein